MTTLRQKLYFSLRRLCRSDRGGMALGFAIALPVLSFIAVGAFDFCDATVDRARMQGVVDAAALAGATQLAIDTSSATAARAQSYATAQLHGLINDWTADVTSQIVNNGTAVQVAISANRPALLQNMLPAGGWHASVSATAQTEAKVPLCALGTSTGGLGGAVISLTQNAQVTAPACLVQSDQDIEAKN